MLELRREIETIYPSPFLLQIKKLSPKSRGNLPKVTQFTVETRLQLCGHGGPVGVFWLMLHSLWKRTRTQGGRVLAGLLETICRARHFHSVNVSSHH